MFEKALSDVLKNEGGYVNDPDDHGGATNYGITMKTLSDFLGHTVNEHDVQSISMDVVREIYKKNYWDRLKLDLVKNETLAALLFDQAVNRGTRTVAEQIQKIVGVTVDGMMGPLTIKSINAYNQKKLIINFIKVSQDSYIRIALSNHKQMKFLTSWINRTHKFMDLV